MNITPLNKILKLIVVFVLCLQMQWVLAQSNNNYWFNAGTGIISMNKSPLNLGFKTGLNFIHKNVIYSVQYAQIESLLIFGGKHNDVLEKKYGSASIGLCDNRKYQIASVAAGIALGQALLHGDYGTCISFPGSPCNSGLQVDKKETQVSIPFNLNYMLKYKIIGIGAELYSNIYGKSTDSGLLLHLTLGKLD